LCAGCSPTSPGEITITLDFDALPDPSPPTDGTVFRGCSYSEDGFTLDNLDARCTFGGEFKSNPAPPESVGPNYINRFSGSTSFFNNAQAGITRLRRSDAAPFTLKSIDVDALNPVGARPFVASLPQTVTFIATRSGLTQMTATFTTDTVFAARETWSGNRQDRLTIISTR
jgi:hypothetical protein